MQNKYLWNPVYKLVMKIKYEYINKTKNNDINFELWLKELNNDEYTNIFDCLQTNQYDNFLLIRYGLAEMQRGMWDDENSIYRECRSIVIDLEREEIVLCPFRKFFNLNEVKENEINKILNDIQNSKVFEITNKLDGSMQSSRYYNGEIFMSGSMALNPNQSWRLSDGYSKLTHCHKKMITDNPEYTFIFEYISIKDAHVVLYKKEYEGMYLIGMRNVNTGKEESYNTLLKFSKQYQVPMAQIETISFEKLLEDMKKYKSHEKEGWVVNIDGHKIKVKCDDYVHLHKLLDKFSSVSVIIENIAENKFDDMLSKIPDNYKERVISVGSKILDYKREVENNIEKYYKLAPKDDKKDFMVWVDNNCPVNIRSYVKCKFLNKTYNILKKGTNGYKKLKDLGISDNCSILFYDLEGDSDE